MSDVLALIEERQAMKARIDELDDQRKAIDARIEEAAGSGVSHFGAWSVTVQDTMSDVFDSTRFRKENPELAEAYTKQVGKHVFKIVALKAGSAA